MEAKKIRAIGAGILAAVWLVLTGLAWFGPKKDVSGTERRKLAQFPKLTAETVLSGKFMSDFDSFTQDQFPMRDGFRRLKALFHYDILRQLDNNGIYLAFGSAAALESQVNEASVESAGAKLNKLYDAFLSGTGSRIVLSVVPDKGYYLAAANGYPAMDYDRLIELVRDQTPWAEYVDLTDCLDGGSYYRTDTHWRQEKLFPAAERLCRALGVTAPDPADYTETPVERPFYGVYYGQAALPMAPDTMYTLESGLLDRCRVWHLETDRDTGVYDREKARTSRDLYDVFLSGPDALLTIENPAADTDRELVVFRDSFGSAMVPLLLADYRTVTVVDTRYISPTALPDYLDFHGQDVLLLYSTLLLNNSYSMK